MARPATSYAHDPSLWGAKRYVFWGLLVIIGLFGAVAYWSTSTTLEGAVIARGELRVETQTKPVQHREGGIVGEILVRDGDVVTTGQPLIRLDRTTETASLAILNGQLTELRAQRTRLIAVRDEKSDLLFPQDMLDAAASDSDIAEIIQGQRNLFAAQQEGYRQQRAQLIERIGQIVNEIGASQSRYEAYDTQLTSLDEDIETQQHLVERGLSTRPRIQEALREKARVEGEIGALNAEEARLKRQIQETQIEITRLRETRREETIDQLRDVETRLAELRQRRIVASEALRRIEISAPTDGVVQEMTVFAPGAVIAPGEPILTIVPVADRLVLEAKLPTTQRDRVSLGQPTRVRFAAFNQRTTPELNGEVVGISADRQIDSVSGQPYYDVEILLPDAERARLGAENELVPGMPADIYIRTAGRTPLNYLLKPILDNFEPAFKE